MNEIHDQRGLRIIVEDEESCYDALAVVHSLWRSAGEEHTKDYIATPKPNGCVSNPPLLLVRIHSGARLL